MSSRVKPFQSGCDRGNYLLSFVSYFENVRTKTKTNLDSSREGMYQISPMENLFYLRIFLSLRERE